MLELNFLVILQHKFKYQTSPTAVGSYCYSDVGNGGSALSLKPLSELLKATVVGNVGGVHRHVLLSRSLIYPLLD